jgi:hypothetical protein
MSAKNISTLPDYVRSFTAASGVPLKVQQATVIAQLRLLVSETRRSQRGRGRRPSHAYPASVSRPSGFASVVGGLVATT